MHHLDLCAFQCWLNSSPHALSGLAQMPCAFELGVVARYQNHHFLWENPLFLWPCSIAMLVHQRVSFFCWMQHSMSFLSKNQPFYPRCKWVISCTQHALHPPHQAGLSFDPHHHESKILVKIYILFGLRLTLSNKSLSHVESTYFPQGCGSHFIEYLLVLHVFNPSFKLTLLFSID